MKSNILLFICVMFMLGNLQLTAQSEDETRLYKNSAFVSLLLSYGNTKKKNNRSLLENVVSSEVINFSVRSNGGYFLKNYLALGIGLNYSNEKENSENVNTFGPNTFRNRKINRYSFTPFMRNYIPIGLKNKFFLFTQTGLEIGFGSGDESNITGNTTTNSNIKENNYGLAFTPGIIFLVQKGFAFEVNVGVLGFSHSKKTVTPENEPETIIENTDFDFKINLLQLNLGISYYF